MTTEAMTTTADGILFDGALYPVKEYNGLRF